MVPQIVDTSTVFQQLVQVNNKENIKLDFPYKRQ